MPNQTNKQTQLQFSKLTKLHLPKQNFASRHITSQTNYTAPDKQTDKRTNKETNKQTKLPLRRRGGGGCAGAGPGWGLGEFVCLFGGLVGCWLLAGWFVCSFVCLFCFVCLFALFRLFVCFVLV
jgi:hypothetical protein